MSDTSQFSTVIVNCFSDFALVANLRVRLSIRGKCLHGNVRISTDIVHRVDSVHTVVSRKSSEIMPKMIVKDYFTLFCQFF